MVDVESEGGVTRIFLNRPEKVNALDSAHLEALLVALRRLQRNPEMRVVVLGGRGTAFCGGAEAKERSGRPAATAAGSFQKSRAVRGGFRELRVPVSARLHGAVIGA